LPLPTLCLGCFPIFFWVPQKMALSRNSSGNIQIFGWSHEQKEALFRIHMAVFRFLCGVLESLLRVAADLAISTALVGSEAQ
jgi:hypothetical protein